MSFWIPTLIVIGFVLPVVTASRMIPILLLSHDYHIYDIANVMAMKLFGNFLGTFYFRRIFFKIGNFRLLTISIVTLIHCFIFLFNFVNLKIFLVIFFIFGFFEQCLFFIVKPLIRNLKIKYTYQLETLAENIIRFFSGLLIMIQPYGLSLTLISITSFSLIPYVLTEKSFKELKPDKNVISHFDSKIFIIITNYFSYFFSCLVFYTSSFISSNYLIMFLTKIKIENAQKYLTIYLLGQLCFSYFFQVFISKFQGENFLFKIHLSIIIFSLIIIFILIYFSNFIFFNLNILLSLALSLFSSIFSVSFKPYLESIDVHKVSVDMTESQMKLISGFFGIILGLFSLHFSNKASIFITILFINLLAFIYLFFKKFYIYFLLKIKNE